jgi:stage II sporulation protein D
MSLCATAAVGDGGGRDVSVAMFSTHAVHTVTITPVGASAWKAKCATCAHEAVNTPVTLKAPVDVFLGGMWRASDDDAGYAKTAAGVWHVRGSSVTESLDVVLSIPSERYVADVLGAEVAKGEPSESLRAMAVLVRTYALNGSHYRAQLGHLAADLCDSTQCQAMSFATVSSEVDDAVRTTAGETLWSGARRAEVYFSQSCGGVTEDGGAVWPSLRGVAYLRSHDDPYCLRHGTDAWHGEIPLAKLTQLAKTEGWSLPAQIVSVSVTKRSASHRALSVTFAGADGSKASVNASALRFGIGRSFGWDQVRSDAYDLGLRNGTLVFDGRGHGHGVGLCQAGATEMAKEGKSAEEILGFYFPGTVVRVQPEDRGWVNVQDGVLNVRSTQKLSPKQLSEVHDAWTKAQKAFATRSLVKPEITLAPTTEVFRQLTGQSGWTFAGTSYNRIVLQPYAVFHAQGQAVSETLLHEMLHLLVESESSERAPLWLREGLVEVIAGEPAHGGERMSVGAMEHELQFPSSHNAFAAAHVAANARVRELITRYGMSAVRGWLGSGVPAGVA